MYFCSVLPIARGWCSCGTEWLFSHGSGSWLRRFFSSLVLWECDHHHGRKSGNWVGINLVFCATGGNVLITGQREEVLKAVANHERIS